MDTTDTLTEINGLKGKELGRPAQFYVGSFQEV
jgi:hypothetical protein